MPSPAVLARLASSQVHITTSPPPRTLRESKLVLAALQRFGEVATFRNLKYDVANKSTHKDQSILAIFETTEAARRAIACSPLTVPLPGSARSAAPSSLPPSSNPATSDDEVATTLTCTISPSYHNHALSMRRNPFHFSYYMSKQSAVYSDLTSKETAIPLKELADALASKYYVSREVKEKIRKENMRMGAGSLMRLWREGMGIDEPAPLNSTNETETETKKETENHGIKKEKIEEDVD